MTARQEPARELPAWLWLWLPPLPLVAIVLSYYVDRDLYQRWFHAKEGPIEWATVIVLVPAVVAGILACRHMARLPERWLRVWLVLVTLGAFYYGGEEISWGQQIWHWDSPEIFTEINRQEETNIHNTSGWFNEKPRLALELWILVGGIVVNLRRRLRPDSERWGVDGWRRWFWPAWTAFPTSVLAILIYLPKRLEKYVFGDYQDGTLLADLRLSEPQELYFAMFLMMYLLSFAVRVRRCEGEAGSVG